MSEERATLKDVLDFLQMLYINNPELKSKILEIPFDSSCCHADIKYPIFAYTDTHRDGSLILYNEDSIGEEFIKKNTDRFTIYTNPVISTGRRSKGPEYIKESVIQDLIDFYCAHDGENTDVWTTLHKIRADLKNEQKVEVDNITDELFELFDDLGLDKENPVENLRNILTQYQKIVLQLTGSFFSKITYDADTIISYVNDRQNDILDEELKSNGRLFGKWISCGNNNYKCSNCHNMIYNKNIHENQDNSFCGRCGARMFNGVVPSHMGIEKTYIKKAFPDYTDEQINAYIQGYNEAYLFSRKYEELFELLKNDIEYGRQKGRCKICKHDVSNGPIGRCKMCYNFERFEWRHLPELKKLIMSEVEVGGCSDVE